jgi:cytochrome P450
MQTPYSAPNIATSSNKDYLAEYDAAPESEKYPLVQKWLKTEPLPFFKQLRKERPVLVTPECTLVALFTDVRDVLQMPKIFTVDLYKPKMGVTEEDEGYLMAHDDDALHYREKSLMQGFLNRDDLPRVRKLIKDAAIKTLEDANGTIEVVNDYCRWVPAVLVQDYFGLNGVDKRELIYWSFWNQYDAFHNQPFDLNSQEKFDHIVAEHDKVSEKLVAYIAGMMARKVLYVRLFSRILAPWRFIKGLFGKESTDDITTRMIRSSMAKEVDFSLLRVGVNAGGLLIGAIETTSQSVAQTIKFFLDQPELLEKAKAAAKKEDTKEFDGMVWEALRYVPLSPYMFRQASEDYTIAKGTGHETTIAKGTNVLTLAQSAMFDDYAFDDPDNFNHERNWYHHFVFGFASHDCLGKYIGMEMIPEMVRQILLLDDIKATSEMDYKGGPFPENYELFWR